MKNLKKKFKEICTWTIKISDEEAKTYDQGGTFFDKHEHAYFIETDCSDKHKGAVICVNDDDFDGFTDEHDLTVWQNKKDEERDHLATIKAVENACDCIITWNAQKEREEVFFNTN